MLAACGLLATSLVALVVAIGDHGERSVDRLVSVPGVTQVAAGGGLGLAAPSGTSPYATYVPPANPPPPTPAQAAAASASTPQQAAPPPRIQFSGGPHHRRD